MSGTQNEVRLDQEYTVIVFVCVYGLDHAA